MDDGYGIAVGLAMITFTVGVLFGACLENNRIHSEACERGYAEYHSVTGDWQWKESE